METTQRRSEILLNVIDRFDFYGGSTNSKAALVAAFNTFAIGAIVLKWGEILEVFSGYPGAAKAAGILLAIAALAALASLAAAFLTVAPYLRSPKAPGSYHSIFFFNHVAEHPNGAAYEKALNETTEDALVRDLAVQALSLAKGVRQKFRFMNAAIWILVVGEIGALALLLLIKLWTVVFP